MRGGRGGAGFLALVVAATFALACRIERKPPPRGVLTLTATEQTAAWTRNFNPLVPGARWPSAGGIYEPLAVFNSVKGVWVPWLAAAWRWEDEGRALVFDLRPGVVWSDGAPFTARDVAFTFDLMHRLPALDARSAWSFLSGVEAVGDGAVRFRLARPFVPGFEALAHQPIVPEHVWSKVPDPITFANPEPVATGPFTEVRLFRPQVYELGRNRRYWQAGRPAVEAIRLPALPGNDAANLALVDGELDWAANYVPAVERVFERRDPTHHHHWFPPLGGTVFLYPNTARAPFDDVRVRKGLSRAIDRGLVVEVAMSRYTTAADATGLSASFESWRNPSAARGDWVRFDAAAAAHELDAAGLRRGPDGVRRLADGRPFAPELIVVNGWSDWVRAAQVVARGLNAVGVAVKVRPLDQGVWFQKLQEGDFDLSIAWSVEGTTPYEFYRWLLHPATVRPVGERAPGNWHRHASAASRPVFDALERELDPARQHGLVDTLQALFVDEAPAIPLFPNPSWGEFSTRRFTGFPEAANPWAALSPNKVPECLLVLTALKPVEEGR